MTDHERRNGDPHAPSPFAATKFDPKRDPLILLPQWGQLAPIIQLSRLHVSNVPALAEVLMWDYMVRKHCNSDILYRYVESVCVASMASGGARTQEALAAMRATVERDLQNRAWGGPLQPPMGPVEGAKAAMQDGVQRAASAADERPKRRFGFR